MVTVFGIDLTALDVAALAERAVFFLFDKSKDVSYWEKKFSSFHHKVVQNFTPVKRFVEKKRARWDLVCNRLSDDDDDDNAEAALLKTP